MNITEFYKRLVKWFKKLDAPTLVKLEDAKLACLKSKYHTAEIIDENRLILMQNDISKTIEAKKYLDQTDCTFRIWEHLEKYKNDVINWLLESNYCVTDLNAKGITKKQILFIEWDYDFNKNECAKEGAN